MAAGFVALALRNPQRAVALRAKFMRKDAAYEKVFSEKIPITLWPTIGHILKRVDEALVRKRPTKAFGEHFLKGWRYLSAFCAASRHFGSFCYTRKQLLDLGLSEISQGEIEEIIDVLWLTRDLHASNKQWTKNMNVIRGCRAIADRFGTQGFEEWLHHGRIQLHETTNQRNETRVEISQEFLNRVNDILPEQPWKPGVEVEIIRSLGCTRDEYFSATNELIRLGIRYQQKDGVVYNKDGTVFCYDSDRVDPETMCLFDN